MLDSGTCLLSAPTDVGHTQLGKKTSHVILDFFQVQPLESLFLFWAQFIGQLQKKLEKQWMGLHSPMRSSREKLKWSLQLVSYLWYTISFQ